MKPCPYCGRTNADEAPVCCQCGTSFAPDKAGMPAETPIATAPARRRKFFCIVAAFALAMLTMLPLGGLVLVQPLVLAAFPDGLWAMLEAGEGPVAGAITAWIIYAVLIAAVMLARRQRWFVLFYIVLCVLLAVNVTGCYKVVNENLQGWK